MLQGMTDFVPVLSDLGFAFICKSPQFMAPDFAVHWWDGVVDMTYRIVHKETVKKWYFLGLSPK